MRWTRAVLLPGRLQLCTTAGRDGARAARLLYRPRRRQRLGTVAMRASSLAISRGLAPAAPTPLRDIDDLFEVIGFRPTGAAAIRSATKNRLVVALVDDDRGLIAKVGSSEDVGLRSELAMLQHLRGPVGPILVPTVIWHGNWRDRFAVATEAFVETGGYWEIDVEEALMICNALVNSGGEVGPLVHGDFAPWNVVRTDHGVALLDWEEGSESFAPLFDLSHFVVAAGALLRRYTPPQAVAMLVARGSLGWRHLEQVRLDPHRAAELVADWLVWPSKHIRATYQFRRSMLDELRVVLPADRIESARTLAGELADPAALLTLSINRRAPSMNVR